MSKQQRAPGDLELVREFVNTIDVEECIDQLPDSAGLASWLAARDLAPKGLRPTRRDLQHAIEVREALRAVLLAHTHSGPLPAEASATLDAAACRARVRLRFDGAAGAVLKAEASGVDGALGRLLA